ncbi:hypothetical protein BH20BAC1_BH20BAC1_26810 [soil metagenome]
MQYKILLLLSFVISSHVMAQTQIPDYYQHQEAFNDSLESIIKKVRLYGSYDAGEDGMEQISFAVIDLRGDLPLIGGVNLTNFIYPASVYKMYVAMEVLKQISEARYSLYQDYVVKSPNDVDKSKEITSDPRPLLRDGDTVTVKYLLDLMITRSDNSAANCLIDLATRPKINETMHQYGWWGSEVTRKFLSRTLEDPGYDTIRSTETCALHAADFMFKIFTKTLINPWVSMQMQTLLGAQLDNTKLASGLPGNVMFYHKTGWWSFYTHDVGIVDDGKVKYIIALFTPIREEEVTPKLKELSKEIYRLMRKIATRH